MLDIAKIEEFFKPVLNLPLECDGMSRVLSYILHSNQIPHNIRIGELKRAEKSIFHFWINLDYGYTIDYSARMWFGDQDNVPHGIFKKDQYQDFTYIQHEIEVKVIDETTYKILTSPLNF